MSLTKTKKQKQQKTAFKQTNKQKTMKNTTPHKTKKKRKTN